jgi:hypothetical protein
VVACERTPIDPLDGIDVTAADGTPGTLKGLLFSAIRSVHGEHGAAAALDLVRPLEDIQRRLEAADAADRAAIGDELRAAQMRIVLLVHGQGIVERTIRAVGAHAAGVQHRVDDMHAAGLAAPEVDAALVEVHALLAQARQAGSDAAALDAATRAAAGVERVRGAVAGVVRVPSLDDLYDAAVHRPFVARLVAAADALQADADAAIDAGAVTRADAATRAARAARIQVVLAGLGPDAVADLIGRGLDRVREQEARLQMVAADRDVSRLERMHRSAADLLRRADRELRRGAADEALDLAGHGADLLNGLEAVLADR